MIHLRSALAVAALLAAGASAVRAQTLEEKRDEKLKKEFLKKASWTTDYDQARASAKESGRPIFAFFTRSYAPCPPCMALESGALVEDGFVKFSENYVLFCHITTQIPGEKYGDLLQEKGGTGFPTLMFMDAEGNVIAEHSGPRTAEGFAKTGEQAKEFLALQKKAAGGDKQAKIDLLIARLGLGQLPSQDAQKELAALGELSEAQKAKLDGLLANAEILETARGLRNEADAKAAGVKFLERHKAGKAAPTDDQAVQPYFILMMGAAEEAKDVASFEHALGVLKAKFGGIPQAQQFFKSAGERLRKLKEGGDSK